MMAEQEKAANVSIHAPLARSNSSPVYRHHPTSVSIHAPLARSNQIEILHAPEDRGFNTCSSCEEQQLMQSHASASLVSIHAPLARSNTGVTSIISSCVCFNTCSSCEEQPFEFNTVPSLISFQYMLLLRGATEKSV